MNFKKLAIGGVIVVSAIALSACNKTAPQNQNTTDTGDSSPSNDQATGAEISYDGSSFAPASLKVKAGQTITVKNTSSGSVSVNSAPHPTHTSFPELNLGPIDAGQSKTLTLSKADTYTYHNHLNSSQKGTIIVE